MSKFKDEKTGKFRASDVRDFKCEAGKKQSFMWHPTAPGLALRVTANGSRAYVFQSRTADGKSLRMTIGAPATWTIPAAQVEARRLQSLIDQGKDPRAEKATTVAEHVADRVAANTERQRREVLATDAWTAYCADRAPRWSARSLTDHQNYAKPGGEKRTRSRERLTKPGPLHRLLARPLAALDAAEVDKWVRREANARPACAALGFRQLRAFINWCAEHPEYQKIVNADACKARRTREQLGKARARSDVLQREQLPAWFASVRKLQPVTAAFLQALLLTGRRRKEVLKLRWEDVDERWQALHVDDKVRGGQDIPLTPYLARLLSFLPRRNEWVFSSLTAASGGLQAPNAAHTRAVRAAGLPHLTLHGLRRSFGTLAEWVECPVGVVAQIQGHVPSAIAEKHYRVRPLDLLRMWHQRIENWILTEAGIALPEQATERAVPLHVAGGTDAR